VLDKLPSGRPRLWLVRMLNVLAWVEPVPERSHFPCMTGKAKKPPSEALQRFLNEGGTTRAGELSRKKRPREAPDKSQKGPGALCTRASRKRT
jgi:hypothetical protein